MASRKPSAEIVEDLPFHQRQWRIQRIAWALTLVVLILALLGLFGDGPLSHVRTGTPTLQIQYERFTRRDNPAQIRIDAQPANGTELRLAVTRDYLHALRVDSLLPYPQQLETTDSEVMFVFRVAAPATSVRITLDVTPVHAGRLTGRVQVVGGAANASVSINQFTFP